MLDRSAIYWQNAGSALKSIFSSCPGFRSEEDENGWIMLTGEPLADFNCAFVADGPNSQKTLSDFSREFRAENCPFLICSPHDLGEVARHLGLAPIGELPLMVLDREFADEFGRNDSVVVSQVLSPSDIRSAVALCSESFGLPGEVFEKVINPKTLHQASIKMLLASSDDRAVGLATVTEHGELRGVWNMVTHPEFRRQGVASCLLRKIYEMPPSVDRLFLLSTVEGRALYEKAGFMVLNAANVWIGNPTPSA